MSLTRCWKTDNPLHIRYHDEEWGTPVHDDRIHFEFLLLEGFQAGLTWELVLKRREALRKAFDGFDPEKVAAYGEKDLGRLQLEPGMIRNRLKIASAANNARRFIEVQKEFGSFDSYIWRFVDGKTVHNGLKDFSQMPAETEESRAMSKDLKKRGFSFVGPTICYAFMQAIGMVNDHLDFCFKYAEIKKGEAKRPG